MEPFVRRFIRSSLIWLGVGVIIGVWISIDPGRALAYRPAHMHANLLGFVSMMIFGVAYHVLPRFTGNPLRSRALASVHLITANAGLALMVGGFMLRTVQYSTGTTLLVAGSIGSAAGAFMFIGNAWATLQAPRRFAMPSGLAPPATPNLNRPGGTP